MNRLMQWFKKTRAKTQINYYQSRDAIVRQIICHVKGHDYGDVVYISPTVLHCCKRCGRDIQGRTVKDLEPMTEDDWSFIETQELFIEN